MRYVEPTRRNEILTEALEQTLPIVVTTRTGTEWLTHKSHFLASPGPGHPVLIAGPLVTAAGGITPVARGELVGVSFRRGHKKCLFGSVIEDVQEYPQAVVVTWPEQVQELQRRVYHRSAPPRGTTVDLRYWPADEPGRAAGFSPRGTLPGKTCAAGAGPPDDAYHATLKDLSVGGLRIETRACPALHLGQTVVCHFAHKRGAPPLTVEATLRHRQREPNGSESLGLQFVGLETTPARQKRLVRLAKIVAEYQRCNYRTGHHSSRPRIPLHR